MMILLFFFLVICEIVRYLEVCRLIRVLKEEKPSKPASPPPKARGSFVVKRMEEKLKQAMYPDSEGM